MFLNADGRYHVVGTSYGPVFVFMPVTCGLLLKWMDVILWVLAQGRLSTNPTLCFKEIQVSTKIKVLPSGTVSKLQT